MLDIKYLERIRLGGCQVALKYFGTDGIRGRAFEPPLTTEDAYRWGKAWAHAAAKNNIENIAIGWDGRTSCTALLQPFLAGFGNGIKTILLGIVPTPAVAWAASRRPNAWGLVVSASHNPPEDNGIKGFDSNGSKLAEDFEASIEEAFVPLLERPIEILEGGYGTADLEIEPGSMDDYLSNLGTMHIPDSFPLVIDCAHGATAPWAGRVFSGKVHWIGTPADGSRINVGVGSTHLDNLRIQVLATKSAAGIAFDGDGDRCLILDANGGLVDGDQMLWLLAQESARIGSKPPGIIGTVMSNGGLEQGLRTLGIPFLRTPVGDKFMARELQNTGWDLAAEASGHLIQRHVGPSGDGLATALAILRAIIQKPPEQRWAWRFEPWPLKLVNIRVENRRELEACPALQKAISEAKKEHGDSLRLVIRWSGTEPLLRLMAEGQHLWQVDQTLESLAAAARADLLMPDCNLL
jgi:phosphoglucosamine mutase